MLLRLHFVLLLGLFIPRSMSFGCVSNFQLEICVLNLDCFGHYTDNALPYNPDYFRHGLCPIISHHIGEFGYVHVTLKNIREDIIFSNSAFAIVTTKLTLSNDYDDFNLATMPHLQTLNLSRNSFTVAKMYNEYELENLNEIDYSHNTISSIEIDKDRYIFRKLKKINLSHNYFVTLDDGVFDSFPDLEELDISFNFIDALNMMTFDGIKKLEYLYIKNNRLSRINLSLFRFNRLKTLDLSENLIEIIKYEDFEKLCNLETLDLSSNIIAAIEAHAFSKITALKILNLHNNILDIISKETFTNLSYLIDINLSKNILRSLPESLFKGKRIATVCVAQNKLEGALEKGMFEGLDLVRDLDLSYQYITSIENLAFYGLNNLINLSLNNNKINKISEHAFHLLQKLEYLDLSNNQITTIDFKKQNLISLQSLLVKNNHLFQIKHEYFADLTLLQFLDVSYNNITQVEASSFKSLRELLNFQISGNPISGTLENFTFDGLRSLPSLDISHTSITAIKNGSFNGMAQLKDLNVSHGKITELQFNAFLQTSLIETVDLSYNQLREFYVNTTEMKNLLNLILNNNLLTIIASNYFEGLPRLSKIIMSHNNIVNIVENAFVDQKDVRYIDLSYNRNITLNIKLFENFKNLNNLFLSGIQSNITFLPVKELKLPYLEITHSNLTNVSTIGLNRLTSLENLVLNNNNIDKLTTGALYGVKQLTTLDLSFNKLTYIQPGSFKDNTLLRSLNISHNLLKVASYGIFRGPLYLDTIDMSYNEISDLQNERFYEVKSLTVLIADNNKITSVSSDDFLGTNLKKLSIGGNPIPCDLFVNLKKIEKNFEITAISMDQNSEVENVDGITCNIDNSFAYNKHEVKSSSLSEKVLLDIRDILHNISSQENSIKPAVTISKLNYSKSFPEIVNNLNTVRTVIENGNINASMERQKVISLVGEETTNTKETNSLLAKLLKVMNSNIGTYRQKNDITTPKENITIENLQPYINNKIRQNVENAVAAARESVLSEIQSKIKQMILDENKNLHNLTNESSIQLISPSHEAYSSNDNNNSNYVSLIFIEVCVGLILVLMVIFIMYKFYNSGIFIPSRHSISTRQLSDALDNSAL